MSVGAYTAANLIVRLDMPFWITIPAGGLMAALIGVVIVGIPSLRIKGIYLAIATLAAQLIIEWTINHVPWISGGVQASIEVPRPSPVSARSCRARAAALSVPDVLRGAGDRRAPSNLVRSRIGRAFIAIRDQDIAAEIIGINIFRYKLYAFAISSFYAGVTGVLYTYYLGIANYEQFQIDVSIDYLAMIIIGGLGSVLGSIFGAIFVTLLPIVTRWFLEAFGGLFFSQADLLTSSPICAWSCSAPDHPVPGRSSRKVSTGCGATSATISGYGLSATEPLQQREEHDETRFDGRCAGARRAPRRCARLAGAGVPPQQKEIVIGAQCDRTGPTQIVGIVLCPAMQDYYQSHQLEGRRSRATRSKLPRSTTNTRCRRRSRPIERQKQQGAVSMMLYGTPQTQALNEKLTEDKIPGTSPGFGISASADGKRYPYLFPVAATYWSQGAAAVQFAKDKLGGSLKGKKIAYVYYDNPAGKEPMPILEDLQKRRDSSCAPSPCRRRGSRWARRCSTSRSATGPIS